MLASIYEKNAARIVTSRELFFTTENARRTAAAVFRVFPEVPVLIDYDGS